MIMVRYNFFHLKGQPVSIYFLFSLLFFIRSVCALGISKYVQPSPIMVDVVAIKEGVLHKVELSSSPEEYLST